MNSREIVVLTHLFEQQSVTQCVCVCTVYMITQFCILTMGPLTAGWNRGRDAVLLNPLTQKKFPKNKPTNKQRLKASNSTKQHKKWPKTELSRRHYDTQTEFERLRKLYYSD